VAEIVALRIGPPRHRLSIARCRRVRWAAERQLVAGCRRRVALRLRGSLREIIAGGRLLAVGLLRAIGLLRGVSLGRIAWLLAVSRLMPMLRGLLRISR